jgi:hypothetical protein
MPHISIIVVLLLTKQNNEAGRPAAVEYDAE